MDPGLSHGDYKKRISCRRRGVIINIVFCFVLSNFWATPGRFPVCYSDTTQSNHIEDLWKIKKNPDHAVTTFQCIRFFICPFQASDGLSVGVFLYQWKSKYACTMANIRYNTLKRKGWVISEEHMVTWFEQWYSISEFDFRKKNNPEKCKGNSANLWIEYNISIH